MLIINFLSPSHSNSKRLSKNILVLAVKFICVFHCLKPSFSLLCMLKKKYPKMNLTLLHIEKLTATLHVTVSADEKGKSR